MFWVCSQRSIDKELERFIELLEGGVIKADRAELEAQLRIFEIKSEICTYFYIMLIEFAAFLYMLWKSFFLREDMIYNLVLGIATFLLLLVGVHRLLNLRRELKRITKGAPLHRRDGAKMSNDSPWDELR